MQVNHPHKTLIIYLHQGRRNECQSVGAMEHWKVLSATMDGRQENFLNSRRCRTAKTVTFWPWWQSFNSFCFETLSFFPLCPFFLFAAQKSGECRRPCAYNFSKSIHFEVFNSKNFFSNNQALKPYHVNAIILSFQLSIYNLNTKLCKTL